MKNLLSITLLLLSLTTHAQWKAHEYVDDFGDPTGEKFQYFQTTGTFSNSATTNSDCGFLVKHDEGETYSVSLYPYNRNSKERFTESTFQTIKLKTPSGKIEEIGTFAAESGTLLFSDDDYGNFNNAISEKGKYIFVLKYEGKYSSSSYRFDFEIK